MENHGNNNKLSAKFCCKWNKQEIIKENKKRDNVHSLKCFRKEVKKIVYNIFVHTVGILKDGKFNKTMKENCFMITLQFSLKCNYFSSNFKINLQINYTPAVINSNLISHYTTLMIHFLIFYKHFRNAKFSLTENLINNSLSMSPSPRSLAFSLNTATYKS